MNFQKVPLHKIIPYENNVKQHPIEQLEELRKNINKFGFRGSILLDKNNVIIAGHARYEAATALGMEEVMCEYASDLTEEQVAEYRIKDNLIAEMGFTDFLKLEAELQKIPDADFGAWDFDFSKNEVKEGLCDEDETPELKIEATTKRGDIWLLGNHRLMCGDSTMINDVEKLMNGEKADMVFTDPPYGVEIYTHRNVQGANNLAVKTKYDPIIGDDSTQTAIDSYNLAAGLSIPVMIFWGANYYANLLPPSSCWLVWDKENSGNFADAELAWTNQKKAVRIFRHLWNGMIRKGESEKRVHPTQKPIALSEWCFNEYGKDAKSILDLFGGSGSTLIACEKTNRKCYMMELAPNYCDVIIKRWQKFTGQEAVLESNGKKFNELSPLV